MCSSGYTGKYCVDKVSFVFGAVGLFGYMHRSPLPMVGVQAQQCWLDDSSFLKSDMLRIRHFGWVVHAYSSLFAF